MAQGKFKKAKLAAAIQKKQKQKNSVAFTRRANAPIQAKKNKFNENQKIKQVITKNVNKSVEHELRGRATEGNINLSKAQEAVAKHHKSQATTSSATPSLA
ncbi:uncharacterized protein LOC129918532 [Episyrphus balteatus]|uniref:uncharacterized protein LOC129918532 n=1 Tax=Episyrphus balteatus TaxID=286459 RepID=UPI002484E5A3|nr:uncharacterized protein LOC129918532 [Episyrphus balteatus]